MNDVLNSTPENNTLESHTPKNNSPDNSPPTHLQTMMDKWVNNPPPSLADFNTEQIDSKATPLVLVDGSYYLFRCFHGLPPLSNQQGLPTNAIRGVLNALNKLLRTYKPTHMAVAFDTKAPTFRHQMSAIYKANRPPMDADLVVQIPYVHRLIKALGIPLVMIDGYEADDIIGTLAYQACLRGVPVVISTGDKDMAQLVNRAVSLEDGFKGAVTDTTGVVDKFGVRANQMIDYLTLMGDASDGIMGVPKVGAKTATRLLNTYDTLDNIIACADEIGGVVGKNIIAHREQIAFDKKLATIITNLDLPYTWDDLALHKNANRDELLALYQELEFAKELAGLRANQPTHEQGEHKTDNHKTDKQTNVAQSNDTTHQPSVEYQQKTDKADNSAVMDNTAITTDYHTITDVRALDELIAMLNALPYFAIDTETTSINWQQASLVGISIATRAGCAYYIPLAHVNELGEMIAGQLDKADVLAKLKPILQNPAIGKIGQHLKYDAHIFAKAGIDLLGCHASNYNALGYKMDTMLASYVYQAAATRHNLDDLAQHYLGMTTTTFEMIAGRGAKQISFDKVDIAVASHYACEDADVSYRLFELFDKRLQANDKRLLGQLEQPVAKILQQMEQDGILVDRKFLMELSTRFDKEILQLQNRAFEIAGEPFNVASPKQLGVILFDKLGVVGGKKTKTGQYSTSEEVLSKIEHPLGDVVLEHRSLSKLKSTYTDALDKACDSQNRVHTSYHQALTSTGRLSSSDPNLQNIPIRTDTGRLIRQAFIAPKGRVLLAADYSQIELRLMAHFSGDERLIDAFCQGLDIHSKTASEILAKPIENISVMERRSAKAVNFGLLYGMSSFGLARQLGVSRAEAKAYIDRYFASYPTIYDYMERTKEQAQQAGYVETILGRKLYMPDVNSNNRMIKEAALRAAINAPLQGSAADIIKLAMVAVDTILPKEHAKLLLQVHDELVFEIDEQKADELGYAIKHAMQSVLSDTAAQMGFTANLAVPLVVDIGVGNNWDEAH